MARISKVRIRKRGKTFSYIFEAGRKEDGKRKVIEKGGFPTREAAYEAGTAAFTDWKHGNIGITSEAMTVRDFVEHWQKNVAADNVKPTTLSTYDSVIRVRILPHFVGVKVQDLTPGMIDQWLRKLHKRGLSYESLRKTLVILRLILDFAVYPAEIISSNPARYIKVPRSAPKGIIPRTIIPQERMAELLGKYPVGDPMRIAVLLLYHTGMRLGEVLGLSWDGIDMECRSMSVTQQSIYARTKRGYYIVEPKTPTSVRKFPIDEELCRELERWRGIQQADEAAGGDGRICVYRKEDGRIVQQSRGLPHDGLSRVCLVCTRRDGSMLPRQGVTNALAAEGLNAHSFRHTHATLLIENGAAPKGVAGRLGHRNAVITQNLYTHNTEKLQEDTAAVFEKAMQTSYLSRQNADKESR